MDKTIVALLVGLLAGAAGGFVPTLFENTAEDTDTVAATPGTDSSVAERLAKIEANIDRLLEGGMKAGGLSGNAPMRVTIDDATMSQLKKATKETVKETLAEMKEEGSAELPNESVRIGRGMGGGRKRMKLADAASELELTGAQEDELRQIYSDTYENMLKLVAGEDGNVEDVRRDIESVRDDPSKAMSVMGKYMPKIFPAKIGDFIKLRTDQDTKVRQAIGDEKATKLRRNYDIEEANPLPIGGRVQVGGMMGGR